MKILHTADWHLGKNLCGISRLIEQAAALNELYDLVKNEGIDIILVCGDIFDTFVPRAEAEELFFKELSRLSSLCPVVCFSGNHDDGERLAAVNPISISKGIHLIGDMSFGGNITLKLADDKLNLGILPYPFTTRIIPFAEGATNEERIQNLINKCVEGFDSGVNVFASHLLMSKCEAGDERELGTAPLLSRELIPECDYAALGHIHKPQSLSSTKRIFYSGSLLSYSFDDKTQKEFFIFDSCTKEVKRVPIRAGRKLITLSASCIEEAINLCSDREEALIKVIYDGDPIKASDLKTLKSLKSFADIRIVHHQGERNEVIRADRPPSELFEAFFESQKGKKPDKELTELFLSLFQE